MSNAVRVVRDRDLEPDWSVKQAKEPGFLRSLITWVGGPEGFVNTNQKDAATSLDCAVGLMRMPVANRQAGVHVHSVAEIYVILKGEVESFDGMGATHRAGPLDCLYIPAGAPHGVRTIGDVDLELIWIHDAIERWGVSTYLDGDGPFPADDMVKLVQFRDLVPDWGGRDAKVGGTLRWSVNWVAAAAGGRNDGVAAVNRKIGIGATVIPPGNSHVAHAHAHPETYVVMRGAAAAEAEGAVHHLGRLDAVYYPPATPHALRNTGEDALYLLWVHAHPG